MRLLKQKLKNKLGKREFEKLPTAFDIVGDIAIVEIRDLEGRDRLIAKTILKNLRSVKTVLKKSGIHVGRYRTQKLTWVAGEKKKETIHTESGVRLRLNVETCYFSTRSSEERLRISRAVKKDESVLVMFSGIGVYPLVISRNSKAKEIYCVEMNPIASAYAVENVRLNKIDNVYLYKGGVVSVVPKIRKRFDRIVMPYPKNAVKYLGLAKKKLKKGGTIHLYTFAHEDEFKDLKKEYKKKFKSVKLTKCGNYAPKVYRVCLDLKV